MTWLTILKMAFRTSIIDLESSIDGVERTMTRVRPGGVFRDTDVS